MSRFAESLLTFERRDDSYEVGGLGSERVEGAKVQNTESGKAKYSEVS